MFTCISESPFSQLKLVVDSGGMATSGKPSTIFCDNGTNFHGARNELNCCIKELNKSNKLHNFCLENAIDWQVNPPAASHMGGIWERMIRSVRSKLKLLVNEQTLTDELLITYFAEIESMLNSRPLCPVSYDARDNEVLTPNHLLLMRNNLNTSPGNFNEVDLYCRKRWRQVQHLANVFWKRWLTEYLPLLHASHLI